MTEINAEHMLGRLVAGQEALIERVRMADERYDRLLRHLEKVEERINQEQKNLSSRITGLESQINKAAGALAVLVSVVSVATQLILSKIKGA